MSMPEINPSLTTREQSITDMFESIALEQTALSHILNAEGEKIQAAISLVGAETGLTTLIAVNSSVESMINAVTRLENLLQLKLELFKNCACEG